MRAKHVIDKDWDLKKFITYIRETYRISWKEIYWKVWSHLHIFKCNRCLEFYPLSEMGNCRFHSSKPKKETSLLNEGASYKYECCGEKVSL